jgi:ABC-type Fe3+/spermidine/putrescine transport system ATPase subunit
MDRLSHGFGDVRAVDDVSLLIHPGEFVTVLGPSGSGKTSLLRIVAGLVHPASGRVFIDDKDVTSLPPSKREIGYVFQHYALFPHLTVFENVAFPLKLRKYSKSEIRARVDRALGIVEMGSYGTRSPGQLSGGQQQRVAVARAIVFDPAVLLMDEPLGSLDKRLREDLALGLRQLQQEVGITTMYVTHDQDEAFSMSDRIAVMHHGRVRQVGTPESIYWNPCDEFVGRFVGDLNYFDGVVRTRGRDRATVVTDSGLELSVATSACSPAVVTGIRVGCGVRPQRVCLLEEAEHHDLDNSFRAEVRVATFRGGNYWLQAMCSSGDTIEAVIPGSSGLAVGDYVTVGWNADDVHVFELPNSEAHLPVFESDPTVVGKKEDDGDSPVIA